MMFLFTNRLFKYSYFLSALLPLNVLLLIWFYLIERNETTSTILWIKIYFIINIIVGLISLFLLTKQLNGLKHFIKHQGKEKIFVKNRYNTGVRDFLLSTFLPILTSFSFKDNLVAAFIMVILFQVFLIIFYLRSSDFMPNICLMLIGYNVFEGVLENQKKKTVYCFSKSIKIGLLIEKECNAVKVGDIDKAGNVYWIIGE